ncbi:MAG: hypothetical protein A2W90_21255 [Bacteroidetes bacterium GWF2_42_66]|nr:MAG: hypothetical protein A2W92_02375 [Bacteroidetes bacterium GWA2_42_15]OFX98864.1 MAG: hypothetical protein A2W89_12895 [Bacteroidetes bacterium GWE2_42_39]OFY45578.1 MAG: hypothetical protein A2W90_21255 [Bacteroidetes bacterium GWF2_42_66]HBL77443.1 hypothetical protein [Prolixibacteraceae bacterium]HCR90991.1 hypothetical protein [Prolixibacteraceae bacterium]
MIVSVPALHVFVIFTDLNKKANVKSIDNLNRIITFGANIETDLFGFTENSVIVVKTMTFFYYIFR